MPISAVGKLVGVMYGESVSNRSRRTCEVCSDEAEARLRITADVFRLEE